jgi:hypothetical protein
MVKLVATGFGSKFEPESALSLLFIAHPLKSKTVARMSRGFLSM